MECEIKKYIFEELEESYDKRDFNDKKNEIDNESASQNTNNVSSQQSEPVVVDKEAIQKELEEIIEATKNEAIKQAEVIKEQAKKEGFEAGYKEGYEQGLKDAQDKFDKTIEEYTKKMESSIKKLVDTTKEISNKYNELESSATDAVLAIVNKIISKKIDEDKDVVEGMVKEALNLTESKNLKIKLNPEDAKNIESKIDALSNQKSVNIVSDDSLSRGSILIEEENGNIIDAGVNTKMEQVISSVKNE
jgi:flagellar assembly protein FliH